MFCYNVDVVVARLEAQTRETHRRLAASSVLLREVDELSVQNFPVGAAERREHAAVAVHDQEAVLLVHRQQVLDLVRVELVVARVEEVLDRLAG